MQPLIHKAALAVLELDPRRAEVSPGDFAELRSEPDGAIAVYVVRESRLPFGLGNPTHLRAGTLGKAATALIMPALERRAHLRVRVVEVDPAHLSSKGVNTVFISVWGNPDDLSPVSP